MLREWFMKLSGFNDDLRELPECFLFPECHIVRENDNYYLISDRFNSLSEAEHVLKEAVRIRAATGATFKAAG
jgi:hypothetical protein